MVGVRAKADKTKRAPGSVLMAYEWVTAKKTNIIKWAREKEGARASAAAADATHLPYY
jgi:hypothetical protein